MRIRVASVVVLVAMGGLACRDTLGVPVPAGVVDPGGLGGAAGAEERLQGAIAAFANAVDVQYSGLLSDEFTDYFLQASELYHHVSAIDARDNAAAAPLSSAGGVYLYTDPVYTRLQQTRIDARLAAVAFAQVASAAPPGERGEMFAVVGYTELLLAEEFCSGVPLGDVLPTGGVRHGTPLTTDSLLSQAVADFDSALAQGNGNDTTLNLAAVALGRALLDHGQFAAAAAAVAHVPTGFAYVVQLPTVAQGNVAANFYSLIAQPAQPNGAGGHFVSVSDREGGNGLNFVSANDPRLPIDSGLGPTPTGTTFYYPAKFPVGGAPPITLADWIEARLVQAEAALHAGDIPGWTGALNTIRADSADTHVSGLLPLTVDSTLGASPAMQVDVMFRERAFWMFGTGHRLGDMRRLIRQYGRAADAVFPAGPYSAAGLPPGSSVIPTYGADVNFPIQAVEQANPKFHGCLSREA